MIPFARIASLIPSLGRENDHEVVAAARAIGALLGKSGHDMHDFADAVRGASAAPAQAPMSNSRPGATRGRKPCFGDLTRACRDLDGGQLTPYERAFVADMVRRGYAYTPSPRQSALLDRIYDRLRPRAA